MLVLSRNVNESIILGRELITIRVLEISGQTVRLGIEAPSELSVHREEIYDKIQSQEGRLSKPPQAKKECVVRTISEPSLGDVEQSDGNK